MKMLLERINILEQIVASLTKRLDANDILIHTFQQSAVQQVEPKKSRKPKMTELPKFNSMDEKYDQSYFESKSVKYIKQYCSENKIVGYSKCKNKQSLIDFIISFSPPVPEMPVPEVLENKVPEVPENKVPEVPENKVPEVPENKVPEVLELESEKCKCGLRVNSKNHLESKKHKTWDKAQKVKELNTKLKDASEHGDLNTVKELIELGATKFNGGLKFAAYMGHIDIVQELLRHGANDFNDAMISAASGGHMEIVKMMINLGATSFDDAIDEAKLEDFKDICDVLELAKINNADQDGSLNYNGPIPLIGQK
jgi:hypothetical protein